jgi:hypothetical protein
MDKPIGFQLIYTPSIKAQKSLNGLIWLLVMEQTLTGNGENNGLFLKKMEIETLLFEFDVDLTKIDTKSCFLKTIFSVLIL